MTPTRKWLNARKASNEHIAGCPPCLDWLNEKGTEPCVIGGPLIDAESEAWIASLPQPPEPPLANRWECSCGCKAATPHGPGLPSLPEGWQVVGDRVVCGPCLG